MLWGYSKLPFSCKLTSHSAELYYRSWIEHVNMNFLTRIGSTAHFGIDRPRSSTLFQQNIPKREDSPSLTTPIILLPKLPKPPSTLRPSLPPSPPPRANSQTPMFPTSPPPPNPLHLTAPTPSSHSSHIPTQSPDSKPSTNPPPLPPHTHTHPTKPAKSVAKPPVETSAVVGQGRAGVRVV